MQQALEHRFCARCGAALPRHLLERPPEPAKSFRLFAGVKIDERDPDGAYLRVSCYKRDQTFATEEGSVTIPGHHVRFSVWIDNAAVCVISLPETEARELAGFLGAELDGLEMEERGLRR